MNLDPIHWAAIVLGIALVVVGSMYSYRGGEIEDLTKEKDQVTAEFETFKMQVKAAGAIVQASNQAKQTTLAAQAATIQGDLDAQISHNRKLYADLVSLRKHAQDGSDTRGSGADSLASATASLACGPGQARLTGALDDLEEGVLAILESRDEAIIKNQACKEYVEGLLNVVNKD